MKKLKETPNIFVNFNPDLVKQYPKFMVLHQNYQSSVQGLLKVPRRYRIPSLACLSYLFICSLNLTSKQMLYAPSVLKLQKRIYPDYSANLVYTMICINQIIRFYKSEKAKQDNMINLSKVKHLPIGEKQFGPKIMTNNLLSNS